MTVTALVMEVRVTATEAAKETWSAALTTVRSSVCIREAFKKITTFL